MTFAELRKTLSPDDQYTLDERAAIIQFDAHQTQEAAERWAVRDWQLKKERDAENEQS